LRLHDRGAPKYGATAKFRFLAKDFRKGAKIVSDDSVRSEFLRMASAFDVRTNDVDPLTLRGHMKQRTFHENEGLQSLVDEYERLSRVAGAA
jgi:hypothetical protein